MAFIFVPNGDGGFTEGDKQTNPDTGVEYIYDSGAWRALGPKIEDEFDTLDERYLKKAGGNLDGSLSIDGTLSFKRGEKETNQFKVSANSGLDFNTNIYGLNGGAVRFRTSHTNNEGDYVGSHIILDPNNGDPQTKIYNLIEPTKSSMAATKEYADQKIAKEGENYLSDAADWKIRQNNSSGSNKTLIQGKDGELGLYNLKAPTQSHHAATREYVDTMGGGPKPAQLAWVYDGDKSSTTSAPADGKFYKNGDYLRFSFKTNNGVDLSNGLVGDTGVVATQYGPIGVIWYYSVGDNSWKMKRQFRTESWRWNYNGHFEFKLSSSKGHGWSTFTQDVAYYITIGGWF